jgi:hypothetical protein
LALPRRVPSASALGYGVARLRRCIAPRASEILEWALLGEVHCRDPRSYLAIYDLRITVEEFESITRATQNAIPP